MKWTQAEFLLRLAENTNAEGDELITEMRRLGAAHAQRLLDESELLVRALEINKADRARFAQYMPQQSQQFGQAATGHGLADQRRGLVQSQAQPQPKRVADNA
jgi:hypothetical protein